MHVWDLVWLTFLFNLCVLLARRLGITSSDTADLRASVFTRPVAVRSIHSGFATTATAVAATLGPAAAVAAAARTALVSVTTAACCSFRTAFAGSRSLSLLEMVGVLWYCGEESNGEAAEQRSTLQDVIGLVLCTAPCSSIVRYLLSSCERGQYTGEICFAKAHHQIVCIHPIQL